MRVRPHCLIISLLLILTLVAWHSISSITGSRTARARGLLNKHISDQGENTVDSTEEEDDHSNTESSFRRFQTKLYQKIMGKPNKEDKKKKKKTANPEEPGVVKGKKLDPKTPQSTKAAAAGAATRTSTITGMSATKNKNTSVHRMDRSGGGAGRGTAEGVPKGNKTPTPTLLMLNDEKNIPDFAMSRFNGQRPAIPMDSTANHDKWIVVTTIAPPTDDVTFLANISGWRVVVVGDTKTPQDWSYPNCIYLSVSKQLELGLATPELLPYKHYARKNVGYLYAVAHGAQVIYETDDDNRPLDMLMSFDLGDTTSGLMYSGNSMTFNPYRHFGQPTLWPRGFPLSQVGAENTDVYKLSDHWITPAIQQGVVNGDPDMDAIFRLTRKLTLKPLDVRFDHGAPPVFLPPGVFSPFNSQNTLFLKDALWALLIPTTTTFRMCDIWRGYWAQRLLWEIGGYIGFYPPNAYQQRNAHDYMADMLDEKDMYTDTDKLLTYLAQWTCPESLKFFQCVYKLTLGMAIEGFWKEGDVVITKHWLEDLVRVGYTEPKRLNYTLVKDRINTSLKNSANIITKEQIEAFAQLKSDLQRTKALITMQGTSVRFVASEQISPEISPSPGVQTSPVSRHTDLIARLCPGLPSLVVPTHSIHSINSNPFQDMLLIIVFNWPFYTNARISEAVYRPIFRNILYCGVNATQFAIETAPYSDRGLSFVEAPRIQAGQFSSWCVVKAMQMNYKVSGYLVTGDDVLLNIWKFRPFEKWRVWMTVERYVFNMSDPSANHWMWWNTPIGNTAYNAAIKSLSIIARLEEASNPDNPENIDNPNGSTTARDRKSAQMDGLTNKAENANNNNADNEDDKSNDKTTIANTDVKTKSDIEKKKDHISGLIPDNLTCRPSEFLSRLYANIRGNTNGIHAISDVYFIPERLRRDAVYYLTHFLAHNVFVELGVATVLYGLENPQVMQAFHGTNLWMEQRSNPWVKYNGTDFFLHPVKMSMPGNLGPLCTAYFPTLLAQIHSKA